MTTPIKDLSAKQFDGLMNGIKGNVTVEFRNKWGRTRHFDTEFPGVIAIMERNYQGPSSSYVREDLEQYQSARPCPVCQGKRLKPEALAVTVGEARTSRTSARARWRRSRSSSTR